MLGRRKNNVVVVAFTVNIETLNVRKLALLQFATQLCLSDLE